MKVKHLSVKRKIKNKKILKAVKGFRHRIKHCRRLSINAIRRQEENRYKSRIMEKRKKSRIYNIRINAIVRKLLDIPYSKFIFIAKKSSLNKYAWSYLAFYKPDVFLKVFNYIKSKYNTNDTQ